MACWIFPDQGLNLCPLDWQTDSYPLCHQGSLRIFSCARWSSVCLWNVSSGPLPMSQSAFLKKMLSCSLYLLDINPSWAISFANTWSHPSGCLFILSIVSVTVQNFLSLIRFHLFIFFFCFLCPRRHIQKYIAKTKVKECSMFPSRCFMISGLIFESFVHYEFIYTCGWESCPVLLFCVPVQCFPTPFLKKAVSRCIFLPPS